MPYPKNSRVPGFHRLSPEARRSYMAQFTALTAADQKALSAYGNLNPELTGDLIENSIGAFSLPLGVATNFRINGRDLLVPMAVEESSVIAAASHGAKLIRQGGGFNTRHHNTLMSGQIQILEISSQTPYHTILKAHRQDLLNITNTGFERLSQRGGGAKELTWNYLAPLQSLVLELHVDTRDAMGANIVNTMCERLGQYLVTHLFHKHSLGLRILTNLSDRRCARATCQIPPAALAKDPDLGATYARKIQAAWLFAWHDKHRAATHNKGIMNGIDPVAIATGNDWRAIEAGAHAYCTRGGHYRPMSHWAVTSSGYLAGCLELPMAVGTVGGVTRLHPAAQAALKLLGHPNAQELGGILCCVGLAQNLAALLALVTHGIQRGHMALHQSNASRHQKALAHPSAGLT